MNLKQQNLIHTILAVSLIPFVVLLILSGLFTYQTIKLNQTKNELLKSEQTYKQTKHDWQTAQNNYVLKVGEISQKFNNRMMSSSNSKLSSIYQSKNHNLQIEKATNTFFNLYAGWNNGNQASKNWDKIKQKNLVSDEVLGNKDLFFDLKDSSGDNKLTALGMQSTYLGSKYFMNPTNQNTADGYVIVSTAQHYKNRWYGQVNKVYHMVYDYKQNKIMTLDLVAKMSSRALQGTQYDSPNAVKQANQVSSNIEK